MIIRSGAICVYLYFSVYHSMFVCVYVYYKATEVMKHICPCFTRNTVYTIRPKIIVDDDERSPNVLCSYPILPETSYISRLLDSAGSPIVLVESIKSELQDPDISCRRVDL